MKRQTATFAAGCFWGVQQLFDGIPGVLQTTAGYMGGTRKNPTYPQVSSGATGHAEAVQVVYDADAVTYERLLQVFWENHDPTQVNQQGPDIGTQYRSVIFYHTPEQREIAEVSRSEQEGLLRYTAPIATNIVAATPFYPADEYHQKYNEKHGRSCHI